MHSTRHADDEKEDGHEDERHEGASIDQPRWTSPANWLTLHGASHFLLFLTKFRMPQVEAYDGSKDLLDHLETYNTLMHLQGVLNKIICRVYPTTLKGPTRVWFNKLTPNIISTFKELSGHFFIHFIGEQRYKRSLASLLNIKQWKDKSLRSYMT